MGLTMQKILNKFGDCNIFSLTGRASKYNITEKEFLEALNKVKEKEKQRIYNYYKDNFEKASDFDKLYEEIEKECYAFINEKKASYDAFITDEVGETTKYGMFFYEFYSGIEWNIEREKEQKEYCINNGKNPLEQIPSELKKYFKYYEVSFSNQVTVSGGLMINYYFELNDETKKYLLKYRNDFSLTGLEDLALYKDNEVKFYSCTHERFNSIELNYKNMNSDEIIDVINNELPGENNDKVIDTINKLINMAPYTDFSFNEMGIDNKELINKICNICNEINLILVSLQNKESSSFSINRDDNFEKII